MADTFDKIREANSAVQDSLQYLTFAMNGEEYGVDIMTVREIKGWTEATRLPNAPAYVRGVINLRGLIIPIFDLRARFLGTATQADASHVVIILAVGERNIGLLVDAVSDILTVTAADVQGAPDINSSVEADFIGGLISLENRMVVLLSVERLFSNALSQIDTAQAA